MNRWMAPTAIAFSLLSGPILLGGSAMAQTAAGGNDSSAPVDISANEQEVINSQCKTIFRGAVEVLQDKARMRANVMTVYNRRAKPGKAASASSPNGGNDCGDVDRVEADGEVFYVTPEQSVRGDHAVYDYATDTIVVTGDVVAVRGQDVARGDRMTIKTKTNDVKMESNATGRGKTRVRAVLYPSDKDKKPAAKP